VNLKSIRKFYQVYSPSIGQSLTALSEKIEKGEAQGIGGALPTEGGQAFPERSGGNGAERNPGKPGHRYEGAVMRPYLH
jgi:hypothetical protein